MTETHDDKPLTYRKRRLASVRGLLVLIAVIALGLGVYLHVEPWVALRKVHPDMATFAALVSRPRESFRCTTCHSQAVRPKLLQFQLTVGKPPHGPGRMLDCKSCHVGQEPRS